MKRLLWLVPIAIALLITGCDGFGLYGKITDEQIYGDRLSAKLTLPDKGPENDAKFIYYEVFNLARKWPEAKSVTLEITIISKRKEHLDFGRHTFSDLEEMRKHENKITYTEANKGKLRKMTRNLRSFLKK